MNLNFHLVHVKTAQPFEHDVESKAFAALVSEDSTEAGLMALAELVDWEYATMKSLTGQGKRCERALKQRVLGCTPRMLEKLASRSGVMNSLFWEMQAEAEALTAVDDSRLVA